MPKKLKPVVLLVLWILIAFLGYKTFMSVYGEIEFNKLKDRRYAKVIENLKDIRDSQLAHRTVRGTFANDWESLVKFIDTDSFTITQRRDTSILDVEATRRFGGVETYKDIVVIDTLDFVSVRDSLFGADPRYKTMMNIPVGKEGAKFELKAGILDQNDIKIPVFEVRAPKKLILDGQDPYLIAKESQVVSVDGVNGDAITVGSMDEVNTNGNWPKNYGTDN
ncbi:MAG: hypothetical protein EX263_06675 [Flavobacteriaceae bacterium]|nr:hypothetical protein [Flavobacteriaceae bacterium]NNK60529.1 hypothetical protein [Flavobacteriaceae bacterium]NNL31995.1 hypothetical protein [Flavobacteriaceae bacterium]RZW52827.1 MAG: hypothetical protein EX263_06675 [Flavobacteriaceae bacterium]